MDDHSPAIGEIEGQINAALIGVNHSAPSVSKYRNLRSYFAELLRVPSSDVYCAYISKASNVRPRFDQSPDSRRASKLIALAEPPPGEPPSNTLARLRRYLEDRSASGMQGATSEAIVLLRQDGIWCVYAVVVPATQDVAIPRSLLQEGSGVLFESYYPQDESSISAGDVPVVFRVVDDIQGLPRFERPQAFLVPDSWDDSGFQTTFQLHVQLPVVGSNPDLISRSQPKRYIGEVKVLKKGMRGGATPLPSPIFARLDESFCSLGQSYSYYENIDNLPTKVGSAILEGLQDVAKDREIARRFEREPGYSLSLIRTGQAVRALLDSPALLRNRTRSSRRGALSLRFDTSVGGGRFTISFGFDKNRRIPGRINALIGYNGTGKTQLLANLAVVATADLEQRHLVVEEFGELLSPDDLRFSSVIALSYSAFDTFVLPADLWTDEPAGVVMEKVASRGELFGYAYCGLRKQTPISQASSRRHLKSLDEVAEDFRDALSLSRSIEKRAVFSEAWRILRTEPSLARLGREADMDPDAMSVERFERLSAGHKIVLNMIAQVVGRAGPGSLVLIDEPECHLHPSLLSAFIRALSHVLDRLDSYAVVATHSPVVLQEIPRRYVRILQRYGKATQVSEPESETFGENVGFLTSNVFDLDSSQTDFHDILRDLAGALPVEEIEDLFDGEMSAQARAYVMSMKRNGRG